MRSLGRRFHETVSASSASSHRLASAVLVAALPFALVTAGARAQTAVSPVAGPWITEDGKAIIDFEPCDAAICGSLRDVLKPDPGASTMDVHNPDPALRTRPVLGMTIFSGFVPDGARLHGRVYDTRSGHTYNAYLQAANDGTLHVTGCIMFFCQQQTWHRAPETRPADATGAHPAGA